MKAFLIALVLISAVVLISPASASAATNAGVKPGSFWYGFDLAFEKINLFFTFNSEGKARKALEYADERLAEAEAVAQNKNTDAVKTAISNYESNVAFAAEKSKDVSEKEKAEALLTSIADNTSKHQEILADVLAKVPDEAKEAIARAIEVSRKGQEEAMKQIAELKGEVEQLKREVEELKKRDEESRATEIERLKKEVEELKKKPIPTPTKTPTPTPVPQVPTQTQIPVPTPSPTPAPPISQPQPAPSYSYEAEASIVDYKDAAAIQATVIGNKGALNLILSGPNKSTVDTDYISENDMLDGSETKWLHLQRYAESNPVAGSYTLIIKELAGKEIFRKTFNVAGCNPTITTHSLSWKPYLGSGQYGYQPDNYGLIKFTVRNDGDITCYIRWIDISLDEKPFVAVLGNALSKKSITPEEIAQVTVGYSDIVYAGNYTLTAKLTGQIDGVLKTLTTYTISVSVP